MTQVLRYIRTAPAGRRPALFLDRDGVLNERIVDGYVLEPADWRPLRGALDALRRAQGSGAAIVVVSNQGALARGLLTEGTLLAIHGTLLDHLESEGIEIDGIYVCPHHPRAPRPELRGCTCRKPAPGMLLQAAADLDLELGRSVMVGDQQSDVAAAVAAGIPPDAALTYQASEDHEIAEAVMTLLERGR